MAAANLLLKSISTKQKPFHKTAKILPFKKTPKQVLATELQADIKNVLLVGGSRCIAGDSIIDGQTKTIAELSHIGKPVAVRTSHGWQMAEAPFLKGADKLLDVVTDSGKRIEVTTDHRFWNGAAWIKAEALSVGDPLACTYSQSPGASSSDACLLVSLADGRRSMQTVSSLMGRCSDYLRRCGRRLRHYLFSAQSCRASLFGEPARIRSGLLVCLRALRAPELDIRTHYLLALAGGHSQIDQASARLSRQGATPLVESAVQSSTLVSSQTSGLSPRLSRQALPLSGSLYARFRSWLSPSLDLLSCPSACLALNDTPLDSGYRIEKVLSITRTAFKNYYTLHVPGSEQYFANCILHHNSGKTFITIRNIIMRASLCPNSRHIVLRKHFNALKRAVVLDTMPKVWSQCFPSLPSMSSCLNKQDWYVELPNGSQIWFGGLDDKERTEKVLGTEYSTVYFNEASQLSWDSIAMGMTRLAENSGLPLRAFFDCNPPTSKHWSYQLFILGKIPNDPEKLDVEDFETEYAHLFMNPIDNMDNLPEDYLKILKALPKRQRERFLHGKFLTDVEGALWDMDMVDAARGKDEPESLIRKVLSIDPATTNEEESSLWGLVVAGIHHGDMVETATESGVKLMEQFEGHVYKDVSFKASPNKCIVKAIQIYNQEECDAIVVETNQGGDMVADLLRLNGYKGKIVKVRASRGKYARAEPVSALYEQGRISHAEGLSELEDELTTYTPFNSKKSPDRLDALVWALTHLFLGKATFSWDDLI